MNAASQDFKANYVAKAVYGGTLTAAGAGDATEVTSDFIDRTGYDSAELVICGRTTCAVGQTLKVTVKIAETGDGGSSYDADVTLDNALTIDSGGAAAHNFVYRRALNIKPRKAGYKLKITPDLSAGATDTAQWGACVIHGGADVLPAA